MDTHNKQPAAYDPGHVTSPDMTAAPGKHTLRVYTLGRFTLVRHGLPLHAGRKSPARPLQLLKALIASGGRQVAGANLAASLWPDREGDQALRAFETTLHRLRKYLGEDGLLLMDDGRLTLNPAMVWVDVWACERQLTRLRSLLAHPVDARTLGDIATCGEQIMRLYQGHFLAREQSTCWSVSLEERLRNRFIHAMLALGAFWEHQASPARAIHCYQRGIEVDALIETFYQRLMLCFAQSGRQAEAIAAYRQCKHVLGGVLGVQPTADTRHIYQSILSRYSQLAG